MSPVQHDPEVAELLAKRRKALDRHGHITEFDGLDENGHKYREETVPAGTDSTKTIQVNLTKMYQASPSTTGDIEILELEAEMVAEGREMDNPHVPSSTKLMEQARSKIEQNGHAPAWEIFDNE